MISPLWPETCQKINYSKFHSNRNFKGKVRFATKNPKAGEQLGCGYSISHPRRVSVNPFDASQLHSCELALSAPTQNRNQFDTRSYKIWFVCCVYRYKVFLTTARKCAIYNIEEQNVLNVKFFKKYYIQVRQRLFNKPRFPRCILHENNFCRFLPISRRKVAVLKF